jgi:tripartite-type tricarboxylate transporter receptor subunit TctC
MPRLLVSCVTASRFTLAVLIAVAALATLTGQPTLAQNWPDHPIRLVVGFGAGGGTDIAARIVADPLSTELGQPVVVENRPGAGGITAANMVAKSPKDGYTALLMSNAHVIAPVMHAAMPYDSVKDFQMLSMIGNAGLVLVTRPDFPGNTLQDVIRAIKADSGKLNFASPGVGTTQHFAVELMNQMIGAKMQHIPFRGTPAAVGALLGGQVTLLIELIQTVRGQIESGQLKAIAVTSPQRFPTLPDVPTFAESGLPDYAVTSWYGVSLPAGTPKPIVDKMNSALHKVLATEQVRSQITKVGALPKSSTPEELAQYITAEIARWEKVRKAAAIEQLK